MNPAQALARWISGVSTGENALAERRRKLEAHCAKPPKSADPAEHRAWLATKRDLEDDVTAEEAALQIAKEEAAKAKAAAEEAEKDVEERRIKKVNDELAKLTTEIGGDAERLAAKLERHADLLAEVENWNRGRGSRQALIDGEYRVRALPDRTIPAEYEERDAWTDGMGRSPSVFRKLPSGELVPAEGGYIKSRERVLVSAERIIRGGINGSRFAAGFKLIGLRGEALFPAR